MPVCGRSQILGDDLELARKLRSAYAAFVLTALLIVGVAFGAQAGDAPAVAFAGPLIAAKVQPVSENGCGSLASLLLIRLAQPDADQYFVPAVRCWLDRLSGDPA